MKQRFLKLVYPSYNLLTIYSVLFFNHEQIDQILIHQQIELLESKWNVFIADWLIWLTLDVLYLFSYESWLWGLFVAFWIWT